MRAIKQVSLAAALSASLVLAGFCAGCGSTQTTNDTTAQETVVEETDDATAETGGLEDGSYAIEVETDSSMFRAESCELVVDKGSYLAKLSLPGEGFSRLYFGSAEDAAQASDEEIYDYYLNDEGKYTFDLPIEALDEEFAIAAFGQRRDTWYDHTIVFHAPAEEAQADAA